MDNVEVRFPGRMAAAVFLASLTAGCGVTITAKKAGELRHEMKEPGIYYALPRTQVSIAVPAVLEQWSSGRVGAVYEDCLKACKGADRAATPDACKFPPKRILRILRPEVTLKGVPDSKHVYYVTLDNDAFASVKHKMTFSESGILTGAESSASSIAYEVAAGVADFVAKVAAKGLKIARLQPRPKAPELAEDATGIMCKDANQIKAGLDAYEKEEEQERLRLDRYLSTQRTPIDADFAKLVIERINARIAAIQAKAARFRTDSDLEEAKKTFRYSLAAAEPLDPPDFVSTGEIALVFRVEAPADEAMAKAPSILEIVAAEQVVFKAKVETVGSIRTCTDADPCAAPAGAGYRYRIPRMGKLTVTVSHKGAQAKTLLSAQLPIAQYGPVAALPGRFEGKGGSVELSISPVTGALTSVAIGAEAAPASAVTAPLKSLQEALEQRRERKEKQAEAARDADKNELERERDLLKLRKEIRDLKNDLGD